MAKMDYHYWCKLVRARFPGSRAAALMDLAELEFERLHKSAQAPKRPESKYSARRSFQDVIAGIRQIGNNVYDLYDDFTPHVWNRDGTFFLFPTIREGCDRYGRSFVPEAVPIGVPSPLPRTPEEWKWGPQNVLITPATKQLTYRGLALQRKAPGCYVVEVLGGRGQKRGLQTLLTVSTHLPDPDFRRYMSTPEGKIDIVSKVASIGTIGCSVTVPTPKSVSASIPLAATP